MSKIIAYKVVTKGNRQMDDEINKMLLDGWQPLGGISVNSLALFQAMVKYAEE